MHAHAHGPRREGRPPQPHLRQLTPRLAEPTHLPPVSAAPIRLLLVEDKRIHARLAKTWLERAVGAVFEVDHVETLAAAVEYLMSREVDVVLLDLWLPDSTGAETFAKVRTQFSEVPVVVLTSADDESLGRQAVAMGAQDYVVKGRADRDVLVRSILYAIERARMDRARAEFFAAISHEFRTPLFAIMANADLLLDPDFPIDDSEEVRSIARTIKGCGQSLLVHVNEILDLSTLAGGSMEMTIDEVDLQSVFTELTRVVGPLARRAKLDLHWEVPDIPPVAADRARLRQVLLNLVSNAIKYTPPGGKVTVRAALRREVVEISVTDSGPGIAPSARLHIFEPYYRVPVAGPSRSEMSTGLGLALTKRLVEAMAGRIWVDTAPGKGTTFTFTLRQAAPVRSGA